VGILKSGATSTLISTASIAAARQIASTMPARPLRQRFPMDCGSFVIPTWSHGKSTLKRLSGYLPVGVKPVKPAASSAQEAQGLQSAAAAVTVAQLGNSNEHYCFSRQKMQIQQQPHHWCYSRLLSRLPMSWDFLMKGK
jgi:hypothetical protein